MSKSLTLPLADGKTRTFGPAVWCAVSAVVASTWYSGPAMAQEMRTLPAPIMVPGGPAQPAQVRPAQASDDREEKPLPPQFAATPGIQEEMEVIHRRSQLVVTKTNVTRTAIADPSVIDLVQYSPTEFGIIGLTLGSTTLTLWFENDPEPLIYLIKVIRDPSLEERRRVDYGKLERKLHLLFPNSKVYLIPMSTKIVVKGQAKDTEEAARILQIIRGEVINQEGALYGPGYNGAGYAAGGAGGAGYGGGGLGGPGWGGWGGGDNWSSLIVNMLEVPGEYQVMIRVKICELSHASLRRLGINFNYLINDGRHAIGYALGGVPAVLSGVFENSEITVLVNALASNGTIKIMQEPTLTVLSGHSASFLSGGEFAVPTIVGINGVGGQQTTFRGFGTSIIVTPLVVDRDLIRLRIVPEYSEINTQNTVGGIPGLNSRRVQTTVELREGQTIVLAGLFAHREDTQTTRIPLLGDIPLIGPALFAAKQATQDEKELLVIVQPELVRPMDADEVPPMPGYYTTHPDDHQLYCYGMTEGSPDQEVYQLAPLGRGNGQGVPVGYRLFEPAPSQPNYTPQPGPAGGMPPNNTYMGPQQPLRPPTTYPQPLPADKNNRPNYGPGYGPGPGPTPVPSRSASPRAMGPSAQYPAQQRNRMTGQYAPADGVVPTGYDAPDTTEAPPANQGKTSWFGRRQSN